MLGRWVTRGRETEVDAALVWMVDWWMVDGWWMVETKQRRDPDMLARVTGSAL
jgi:hypothetical protein